MSEGGGGGGETDEKMTPKIIIIIIFSLAIRSLRHEVARFDQTCVVDRRLHPRCQLRSGEGSDVTVLGLPRGRIDERQLADVLLGGGVSLLLLLLPLPLSVHLVVYVLLFLLLVVLLLLLFPPGPTVLPIHEHALDEEVEHALREDDTHDVVDLPRIHRYATVSALPHDAQDARDRHRPGHRHDLDPRFHDLADLPILQVQHPLDHLLLGVIDGAGIPRSRDDETQFGVAHPRLLLRLDPEQAQGRLREVAQRVPERSDGVREDVYGRHHEARDPLGVDDADVLGEELDEEERYRREEYRAVLLRPGRAEDVVGEVGEERRGVYGARRGRDEYRGEDARDVVVQSLERPLLPPPAVPPSLPSLHGRLSVVPLELLLLLGEFAHLPRIQGRDGDFGRVQQREEGEYPEPYRQFRHELVRR